jgi:hypothetical protein
MKKTQCFSLLTIYILLLTLVACSSTQKMSSTIERDGSAKEKAIFVKSIDAEYAWIKANYPNSKVTHQALIGDKSRYYDLLTFVTEAGETRKAYFDITSFFGKGIK